MIKFQMDFFSDLPPIVITLLMSYILLVFYKWWTTKFIFQDFDRTVFNKDNMIKDNTDAPGEPSQPFPNAWYPLILSEHLKPGQVKPIYILERDLVVYRAYSGKAYVLDAYCPHQGAHLGVGGSVVGDDIRCPFHNWKFNGDGICTDVPGLPKPPSAKIKTWKICEMNQFIYIWYNEQGLEPDYIPPQIIGSEQEFCVQSHHYMYCQLLDIAINLFDTDHLDCLHSCTYIAPNHVLSKSWLYDLARKIFHYEIETKYNSIGTEEKELAKVEVWFTVILFGWRLKFTELKTTVTMSIPSICQIFESTYFNFRFYTFTYQSPETTYRMSINHYSFADKNSLISKIMARIQARLALTLTEAENILLNNKRCLSKMVFTKLDRTQLTASRWVERTFSPKGTNYSNVPLLPSDQQD